jgi:hypothetical protein
MAIATESLAAHAALACGAVPIHIARSSALQRELPET